MLRATCLEFALAAVLNVAALQQAGQGRLGFRSHPSPLLRANPNLVALPLPAMADDLGGMVRGCGLIAREIGRWSVQIRARIVLCNVAVSVQVAPPLSQPLVAGRDGGEEGAADGRFSGQP